MTWNPVALMETIPTRGRLVEKLTNEVKLRCNLVVIENGSHER